MITGVATEKSALRSRE